MGLFKKSSWSSFDTTQTASLPDTNPNPANWMLVREQKVGRCVVVELEYPDCTNYEGRKIMVFEGASFDAIKKKNGGKIDPHFFDGKTTISPVARFEPTVRGWALAISTARQL